MNDGKGIDRSLEDVNGTRGISFPKLVQGVTATVVAAYILAISFGGWHLRDVVRDNAAAIEAISSEQKLRHNEIKEFHKWPRYTHKEAKELEGRLAERLIKMESAMEDHEDRMDAQERRIFELPYTLHYPFTDIWQNRILKNKDDIAECGCFNKEEE